MRCTDYILNTFTGIADSGSGIGGIVLPPLVTWLLNAFGWKGAMVGFSVLCLSCILFALTMAPGPASQQSEDQPESKDIIAETTPITQSTSFVIITNVFFLLVASSNFIGHLGMFVPYTYIPDAASLKDIPTDQSNYLLSIMGNDVTIYVFLH